MACAVDPFKLYVRICRRYMLSMAQSVSAVSRAVSKENFRREYLEIDGPVRLVFFTHLHHGAIHDCSHTPERNVRFIPNGTVSGIIRRNGQSPFVVEFLVLGLFSCEELI